MCIAQARLPFVGGAVTGAEATVQRALQHHMPAFRRGRTLSPRVARVLWRHQHCRTAAMGGYRYTCEDCRHSFVTWGSCNDANCGVCQGRRRRAWAEHKAQLLLPVPHFQVVFTVPDDLWPLLRQFPKLGCGALFEASAQTLLELARSRWKATPAVLSVLHTWDRKLQHYPHVHMLVSAGGRRDDGTWRPQSPRFLFHNKPLRKLFRGKFLDALARLGLALEPAQLAALKDARSRAALKRWHVWITAPEGRDPTHVVRYLARYVNQGPISDRRILRIDGEGVTLRVRGEETLTLSGPEFVRRLALHVPPAGLRKCRQYGLLAASHRPHLEELRAAMPGLRAPTASDDTVHPETSVRAVSRGDHDLDDEASELALAEVVELRRPRCPHCHGRTTSTFVDRQTSTWRTPRPP